MASYTRHLVEPKKNRTVRFHKPEGPVLLVTTIFQILDVSVLKPDVLIFTS
jgi:hypothetical protein